MSTTKSNFNMTNNTGIISSDALRVMRIANRMPPALRTAAEKAARMQIDLQPLLTELRNVKPSTNQISKLLQEISLYAKDMEFSDNIANDIGGLTDLEKQEAAQTVCEILTEPENREQKLAKYMSETRKRHPISAKAIIWLLGVIINIALSVAFNSIYDTKKMANLREGPTQQAPVVTIVDVSQTVNVIDDAPYYFKIEYTESETGEIYTGWISKRSVQGYEEHTNIKEAGIPKGQ